MATSDNIAPQPALGKQQMAKMLEQRERLFSLPQPFYNGTDVFQAEMEGIFAKEWLFAGLTCEIPEQGNYITLEVGDNPITIVRDQQGNVQAYHNVCRHRGSKLCLSKQGKVAKLVCPYHQWTYELSGELIYAGQDMGEAFNTGDYPLHPVQCRTAGGYIFISLAENPPEIDGFLKDLESYLEPYDLDNAKVAVESTLIEQANWKLVIENNRECYHCNGSHPELLNTLLEWDDTTDPRASEAFKTHVAQKVDAWESENIPHAHVSHGNRNRLVRMPLIEGTVSMTIDGKQGCKKLMGRIKNPDLGSLRILHLPNSWNHAMGDHLVAFQVLPLGPQKTQVTTKWLVHKDAVEGVDYDVENLRRVWDATNKQDRTLAENNQRGINSMAYQPGPYSETYEFGVVNFLDWYSEAFLKNLSEG
jgi:glycine betaine monooxygenase A